MNYSVIDNKKVMAPKAHHTHCRLASPSTGLPRGQGDPRGHNTIDQLGYPTPDQTGQEGANGPQGTGADNGPPSEPGSKENSPNGNRTTHRQQGEGRGI